MLNRQALADKLVGVPWALKVLSTPGPEAREACYFFKYIHDSSANTSCFLITDTIHVWAEVLDSKHTSHRARHVHSTRNSSKSKRGFALPYHDADEEADWRRGVVKTLGQVHEGATDGFVDIDIRESELSDMSVFISDTIKDFYWRWDVMSVRKLAAGILSTQLFMPLVTIATVTSSLGVSAEDASDETLRTHAERKASTAKAMPVHHMRGFFSRPAIQTLLKCIAQVDGSSGTSLLPTNNKRNPSLMSLDMAEPVDNAHRIPDSTTKALTRTSSSSPGMHTGLGSSRKGKGRDSSTEDEDEGVARKIPRGTTPRRSNIRSTDQDPFVTPFSKARQAQADPDSTATEAETTRDWSKNIANTTLDEDEIADPPQSQTSRPPSGSPKPTRPSPRTSEKPKTTRQLVSARTPARPSVPDVFSTQIHTQPSSDDSDREAELERRVRAAGAIGSAAVRTPAGGGLGSRMVRKKF
ncbi:unnamed protein product [Rhizoctonia solani]|uniref:XLF-like N-terminal domain-containing protein n=1 Tax=Rhizoctonia solani TaxID=456999 RepID=A0A8H3BDW8_9AGAM|nr:unnamed protein product [Rhizoctonia solani]